MKYIKLITILSLLTLSSCNYVTRVVGGSMTVDLEKDQKLVNVSWKHTDLWVLTRARKEGEQPETYKYVEHSTFGVLEGVVTINEK